MEFGFVSQQVISDLQDIGNWKSRASAIDNLHKALRDVGDKSQVLPGLPRFVTFLVTLVADPNFKIAISSMEILSDLVSKVGQDLEPHLRSIIPNLLEKFTDSKALVRSASYKVLRNLATASQPQQLVDLLGSGMTHSNSRVREEVVNTLIMVMLLPCGHDGLNYTSIFRLLSLAVEDPKDQVKCVGLEGMAVLAKCAGSSEVTSLLAQGVVGLGSEACAQVRARLANPALPFLREDGMVQHIMEPRPDTLDSISSDLPPSRRNGLALLLAPQHFQPMQQPQHATLQMPGKLPWEAPPMPRPRLHPEGVTVKNGGLDFLGPLSASANGGVQVSPSSSCASPAGAPAPSVWRSDSLTHDGSNLNILDQASGAADSPPNSQEHSSSRAGNGALLKGRESAELSVQEGGSVNNISSFGRYASSNMRAAHGEPVSSEQQQQQQQQHNQEATGTQFQQNKPGSRKTPSPPARASKPGSSQTRQHKSNSLTDAARPGLDPQDGHTGTRHQGGELSLADLGSLQGGRAVNSLPLGVLDGPQRRVSGQGSLRESAMAQGPHGLALSASLTTSPLYLPSPLSRAPYPPDKEAPGEAGSALRPRRGLRSPPTSLQSSADITGPLATLHDPLSASKQGLSALSGGSRAGLGNLGTSSQSVVSAAREELDASTMLTQDMVRGRVGAGAAKQQQQQLAEQQQRPGTRHASKPGPLCPSGSSFSLSGLVALKQNRQTLASRALDQGPEDHNPQKGVDLKPHKKDGLSALRVEHSGYSSPTLLSSPGHLSLPNGSQGLRGGPSKLSQSSQAAYQTGLHHQQGVGASHRAFQPSGSELTDKSLPHSENQQGAETEQPAPQPTTRQPHQSIRGLPGPCQSPMQPDDRDSSPSVHSPWGSSGNLAGSSQTQAVSDDHALASNAGHGALGSLNILASCGSDAADYLDMLHSDHNSPWGDQPENTSFGIDHAGNKEPTSLSFSIDRRSLPHIAADRPASKEGLGLLPQREVSPPSSSASVLRPIPQASHPHPHLQPTQHQALLQEHSSLQQTPVGLRPLWLHGHVEEEAAMRPETFSPNKVELLANLKRRQIEKRVPSSQLPSRKVSGDDDSDLQLHPSSKSSSAMLHPSQGLATFHGDGGFHSPLQHTLDGTPLADPANHSHQQQASQWAPSSAGAPGLGRGSRVGTFLGRKMAPLAFLQQSQLPPCFSPQLVGESPPAGQWGSQQGSGAADNEDRGATSSGQEVGGNMREEGLARGPGSAAGIEALRGRGRGMLTSRGSGSPPPPPPQQQQAGGSGLEEVSSSEGGTCSVFQRVSGAARSELLTAQHLGLQRISTQGGVVNPGLLAAAHSAPPIPNQELGSPSSAAPVVTGSKAGGSNCASPAYAARTRLAPAMFERLRLRSADMVPTHGGGDTGTANTPTYTQPPTPVNGAEGLSPLTSAKAVSSAGNFWGKSMKPMEELSTADLTPLPEPERSLRSAISKMIQANNADRKELDWQGQHDAINDSRRIVAHHPEVLRPCLHEFVRAAVPALDQLRSVTVKNAITLMQEMFVVLGRQLDRELDDIVPMLLKKAGEVSNAGRENFLAAEADRALAEMCRRASEHRAVAVLCAHASHKSMHVRAKVGSHLDSMMELPNVRSMLASNQQCLDRLFKVAAGFLNEGGLETRTYGKRIIFSIKTCHSKAEMDRLVGLVQPEMLARKVSDVVDATNALPPVPCTAAARGAVNLPRMQLSRQASGGSGASFTSPAYPPSPAYGSGGGASSAGGGILSGHALQDAAATSQHQNLGRGKQSISAPIGGAGGNGTPPKASAHCGLRGPSSGNSNSNYRSRAAAAAQAGSGAEAVVGLNIPSRAGSTKPMPPVEGLDLDQQEALTKALASLGAQDFRERIEVLKSIEGMAQQQSLAAAPEPQIVELLDGMTARISEGNAKVAIQALETLGPLFHCLRGRCSVGLNTLVPALAATLGSSNDKIRGASIKATDSLVEAVDPVLLIQNFAHCASHSSLRGRPLLVERLLVLARTLWPGRPTLVIKHALPATFSLLNDAKGDGRTAANVLLTGLAQLMGAQLLEHTAGLQELLQQRVSDAVAATSARCRRSDGSALRDHCTCVLSA